MFRVLQTFKYLVCWLIFNIQAAQVYQLIDTFSYKKITLQHSKYYTLPELEKQSQSSISKPLCFQLSKSKSRERIISLWSTQNNTDGRTGIVLSKIINLSQCSALFDRYIYTLAAFSSIPFASHTCFSIFVRTVIAYICAHNWANAQSLSVVKSYKKFLSKWELLLDYKQSCGERERPAEDISRTELDYAIALLLRGPVDRVECGVRYTAVSNEGN